MSCPIKYEKFRFMAPCSVIVNGGSNSGKTTLIGDIILHKKTLINLPVNKIIFYYKTWQPAYDILYEKVANIQFENEVPESEPEQAPKGLANIVVFDDLSSLLNSKKTGESLASIFRIFAHHRGLVTFYVCHNIFDRNNFQRTMSLSTSYLTLFRNFRDSNSIKMLANQIYDEDKETFMKIYRRIMKSGRRHAYLCININPCTDTPLSIHTNIIPSDSLDPRDFELMFIPKNNNN